jgi:hypothetical protein
MTRLEDFTPNAAVHGILPDGHGGQRLVVRLGGTGADVQDAGRQGGQRAALSPRRGPPRGGGAWPAVEL